eukprot:GEMP01001067.1.p1 GENE.GEMP01001067.1~~GEMP01001067.1.p1  ORF type:complete len:974 (+),score=262.37 GEMP01001067.1:1468-4389(+)
MAPLVARSLQAQPDEKVVNSFRSMMGDWYILLKWLCKEFRLKIGFEMPDEEAGIQFWIDNYEGRPFDIGDENQYFTTHDEPNVPATAGERNVANSWSRSDVVHRLYQFWEIKRKIWPHPILAPLIPASKRTPHNAWGPTPSTRDTYWSKHRKSKVAKEPARFAGFGPPARCTKTGTKMIERNSGVAASSFVPTCEPYLCFGEFATNPHTGWRPKKTDVARPWWKVDLGREFSIIRVKVKPHTAGYKLFAGCVSDMLDFIAQGEGDIDTLCKARYVRLEFQNWKATKLTSVIIQQVWQLGKMGRRSQVKAFLRKRCMVQAVTSAAAGFWTPSGTTRSSFNARAVLAMALRDLTLRHKKKVVARRPIEPKVDKSIIPSKRLLDTKRSLERASSAGPWLQRTHRAITHVRRRLPRNYFSEHDVQAQDRFVEQLGKNFKSHKYPNYFRIFRWGVYKSAKALFEQGFLEKAKLRLQEEFNIQQIMAHYRCEFPGCKKPLPAVDANVACQCTHNFCAIHRPPHVHKCQRLGGKGVVSSAEKGRGADKLGSALDGMREKIETKCEVDEKFDDKETVGLLMCVLELTEAIVGATQHKEKEQEQLMALSEKLRSRGPIRLAERPFRARMCPRALEQRRAHSSDNVMGTGQNALQCQCSLAHKVSELRFHNGECGPERREHWVKAHLLKKHASLEILAGSAAEKRPFQVSASAIGSWCPGCGHTFTLAMQKAEGGTGAPKGQCAYCSHHKRAAALDKKAAEGRAARARSVSSGKDLKRRAVSRDRVSVRHGSEFGAALQLCGKARRVVHDSEPDFASAIASLDNAQKMLEEKVKAPAAITGKSEPLDALLSPRHCRRRERARTHYDPLDRFGWKVTHEIRELRELILEKDEQERPDKKRTLTECNLQAHKYLNREHRKKEEARRTSSARLMIADIPVAASRATAPSSGQRPGGEKKRVLCLSMLDAGECKNPTCTFAHHPSEL